MIQNSFIFLDQIDAGRERMIWKQGITTWEEFLSKKTIAGLSPMRKGHHDRQLAKAAMALDQGDARFFKNILDDQHAWRLYPRFCGNACFLDIETTGKHNDITVVGLYNGEETATFVKGFNLDKHLLQKAMEPFDLVVTFNGSSFDLPTITRYFGGVLPPVPHIDLRHVCTKIGLHGGLKKIEERLGIQRDDTIRGMDGYDAVKWWQAWIATGNKKHLEKLIQYNTEDIVNLKPIAEQVVPELWKTIRFGEGTHQNDQDDDQDKNDRDNNQHQEIDKESPT